EFRPPPIQLRCHGRFAVSAGTATLLPSTTEDHETPFDNVDLFTVLRLPVPSLECLAARWASPIGEVELPKLVLHFDVGLRLWAVTGLRRLLVISLSVAFVVFALLALRISERGGVHLRELFLERRQLELELRLVLALGLGELALEL